MASPSKGQGRGVSAMLKIVLQEFPASDLNFQGSLSLVHINIFLNDENSAEIPPSHKYHYKQQDFVFQDPSAEALSVRL